MLKSFSKRIVNDKLLLDKRFSVDYTLHLLFCFSVIFDEGHNVAEIEYHSISIQSIYDTKCQPFLGAALHLTSLQVCAGVTSTLSHAL